MDWGRKCLVDFNAGKIQLVLFDQSNNTGAIDIKMDGAVLEEKSSFKMLGLTFSSKLDCGSYIISIAKTASKIIGALIHSMKFLYPEVALYLYKSTIRPCIECCCHVWAGAPGHFSKYTFSSKIKVSSAQGKMDYKFALGSRELRKKH